MGAQLSLKAALPWAERIATASDRCSKTRSCRLTTKTQEILQFGRHNILSKFTEVSSNPQLDIQWRNKCKGAFTQGVVLLQRGAAWRCLAALLIGSSWFQQASLHWRAAVWRRTANWVSEPIYGAAAAATRILELIRQLPKQCPV